MLVLTALACRQPPSPDDAPPPLPHSAAPSSGGAHSAEPDHSAEPRPVVRCSDLAAAPLTANPHPTARAFHDVVFDGPDLLGTHDGGLWRFPHDGAGELLIPDLGVVHQLDWLAAGGLAALVDASVALERLDPEARTRVLLRPGGGYSVRVGPGDFVWVADGDTLARLTPGTWEREVVVASLPDGRPRAVAFDRGGERLFLGTIRGSGVVYVVPLDASGGAAGPPEVFATAVGGGWHDALGVDACGHVYVTDALTATVVRLDPAGTAETVLQLPTVGHAHGLRWGSGEGGWRSDALYVAQPYGGDLVAEVVVGVPAADWNGGRYDVVP
jgi:hypothetical protein